MAVASGTILNLRNTQQNPVCHWSSSKLGSNVNLRKHILCSSDKGLSSFVSDVENVGIPHSEENRGNGKFNESSSISNRLESSKNGVSLPSFSPIKHDYKASEGQSSNTARVTSAVERMAEFKGTEGPPRWFCPLDAKPIYDEAGSAKAPFPRLFFLPGIDGSGLGLILQHKSLARIFDLQCLHIPVTDRTDFEGLVQLVSNDLRREYEADPNRAMFLIGESFGAMLSMAVAARNRKLPLRLVLINPATSFQRSPLHPFLPLFQLVPESVYEFLPILLSTTLGDPIRMAFAGTPLGASPLERAETLRSNLLSLLPKLPLLAKILPRDTLAWKLEGLDEGSRYMEKVLECISAPILLLASGEDRMLPSKEESRRLKKILPQCIVRDFPDSGHAPLLEEGIDAASYIKSTGFYRRTTSKSEDPFTDSFLLPTQHEYEVARNSYLKFIRQTGSPVSFSTLEDGTIVQGLEGIPQGERPLLFIGNHQTWAPDLGIVIDEILRETGILVRGLAHPAATGGALNGDPADVGIGIPGDFFRTFGAVPVTGKNMYNLLAANEAVLMFPGGVREAYRKKGEEYQLFWPDRTEFVRMAVKFGATIIPYAAVGVDDGVQMLLDADDIRKIPILGKQVEESAKKLPRARQEGTAGAAEELFIAPIIAPSASPKRLYFLFQKPIRTREGYGGVLKDREEAQKLYLHVKNEVESGLQYLLKKREEDPYKDALSRILYEASWNGEKQAPTFTP